MIFVFSSNRSTVPSDILIQAESPRTTGPAMMDASANAATRSSPDPSMRMRRSVLRGAPGTRSTG